MSKTNCINCGSAKDINEIKCPFCGTTYLDLTAIDFDSGKPVVCQFILPNYLRSERNGKRTVMSMLAIPRLNEISAESDTCVYDDGGFGRSCYVRRNLNIEVGVSFTPVSKPNTNSLLEFRDE